MLDYWEEIEVFLDGSLQFIVDFMIRCIDVVGLGGWMVFDGVFVNLVSYEDVVDYFGWFNYEIDFVL